MTHRKHAMMFKAFCDESRLKIIEELKRGERCACHLLDAMSISQSTLSHHMKILTESGMVNARREGRWVYYAINKEGVNKGLSYMRELLDTVPIQLKSDACGRDR